MAVEWCTCGNNITAGKTSEDSILFIITEKQFNKLTERDVDSLLMVLPDICQYEYFLCPRCQRVTALNPKSGKKAFVYALERKFPENVVRKK
ncbi:MAG: hypothetical protein GX802_07880 [Clostridiales bacterium]|jgi:hypothetical protein|nr:hypothetical protein [Clostridiales bacterium]